VPHCVIDVTLRDAYTPPGHSRVNDLTKFWATAEQLAWGSVFSTSADGTPYATFVPASTTRQSAAMSSRHRVVTRS
jgi:hypothetical protein